MLQRKGLLCVVKAMAIILLMALAMPTPVSAQSDMAARVKIQGAQGMFGDVLLVRDTDNGVIVVYGLNGAAPGQGQVTITPKDANGVNTQSPMTVNTSFIGKFPIRRINPIRIDTVNATPVTATINALRNGVVIGTGAFTLEISGEDVRKARLANPNDPNYMPPHRLLDVQVAPGFDASSAFVGKILLTQRVVVPGPGGVILDEFEGISNSVVPGSGLAERIRSVTPFSQIGVYSKPVDVVSPDRVFRIATISTETFFDGAFESNGAFMPFTIANVNSFNRDMINSDILSAAGLAPSPTDYLYFRIQAMRDNDLTTGSPPRQLLAVLPNDITAGIVEITGVVNNNPVNGQVDANAPGSGIIAVISGKADPYSLITAHIQNATTAAIPEMAVTVDQNTGATAILAATARANAAGEFTLPVPAQEVSKLIAQGILPDTFSTVPERAYLPLPEVYLIVSDPFGNVSAYHPGESLYPVEIDRSSYLNIPNNPAPPAQASPTALYSLSGVAEPESLVLAVGVTRFELTENANDPIWQQWQALKNDSWWSGIINNLVGTGNKAIYETGFARADATGNFVVSASSAYQYAVIAVDQAGNMHTSGILPGKQSTQNPVVPNTGVSSAYPFIQVTGTAEPFANIRVYGFPAGELPVTDAAVDVLPAGAAYLGDAEAGSTTQADGNGNFTLVVPSLVSRAIFVQAIDFLGNESQFVRVELVDPTTGEPLTSQLIKLANITVVNNPPRVSDIVRGQLVDPITNAPILNPQGLLKVSAFSGLLTDINTAITADMVANGQLLDVTFPFVDEIGDMVDVNPDGTFEVYVRERSRLTNQFISSFFVVALETVVDFDTGLTFVRPIGFEPIDANDGLDRIGPRIVLAPASTDIRLTEKGAGENDIMDIRKIYPAEMRMGDASLPADASPFIVVFADDTVRRSTYFKNSMITDVAYEQNVLTYTLNTAGYISELDVRIDVNSLNNRILDIQPLNALTGLQYGLGYLPIPGVTGLNLGQNYWDRTTQSISGYAVVFVALIDSSGNMSPNPIPIFLDVNVQNPDISKITAGSNSVVGEIGAVEPNSVVSLYESSDRTGWIATTQANELGGFAFNNLTFNKDEIFIATRDLAGNESVSARIAVNANAPQFTQFLILDCFGMIHTRSASIPTEPFQTREGYARALAGVELTSPTYQSKLDADSPLYVIAANGKITKIGDMGKLPLVAEQISIAGQFARDVEVISSNPFKGYILLGNGTVIPLGGAPFYGDIVTLQRGDQTIPARTRLTGNNILYSYDGTAVNISFSGANLLFDDVNGNGKIETEDKNQNGQLDIVVLPGGSVRNEDVNGNNQLDSEVVNLDVLGQGFYIDIARDLELVRNASGDVLGYVILDGNGILWPFFKDQAEQTRQQAFYQALSLPTAGFSVEDLFQAFELILDETGLIQDYILLNGYGHVYGVPGGLMGAGESTDVDNRGILTGVMNAKIFDVNIARDIRQNLVDSNNDGVLNWLDGFYVLDGYGGINPIGGAPVIKGAPFLGLDIATDLEFGAQPIR
ncbi:MAG: hypothetical protein C4527_16545 [Candidatus Omnitrophota bacterium]|jgi:hypothetical protein|nr:MAG: hypothetical protein C4527_16545 [Candidatus Omnitrophota bacterium]